MKQNCQYSRCLLFIQQLLSFPDLFLKSKDISKTVLIDMFKIRFLVCSIVLLLYLYFVHIFVVIVMYIWYVRGVFIKNIFKLWTCLYYHFPQFNYKWIIWMKAETTKNLDYSFIVYCFYTISYTILLKISNCVPKFNSYNDN